MASSDDMNDRPEEEVVQGKKPWISPEVHDQSVQSLTEAKPFLNPTEASPSTGS